MTFVINDKLRTKFSLMQENRQNIAPIKGRILDYLEYQNIKKSDFFKKTKIAASNFKASGLKSEIGGDKIVLILSQYHKINPTWLLTGEGEMLLSEKKKAASPLSGKENLSVECKECEKLKEKISFLEQLLEAKNETIKAYQSKENIAADDVPSKGRNSA